MLEEAEKYASIDKEQKQKSEIDRKKSMKHYVLK